MCVHELLCHTQKHQNKSDCIHPSRSKRKKKALKQIISYLLLVGGTNVEVGDDDGCPWHQVELGVSGSIIARPEKTKTDKTQNGSYNIGGSEASFVVLDSR